mmetsp:Transcript_45289/g.124613  ORF Transcript_45289/g.124613 Transcript_45289/m.124613 type:complete len:279 (-) Transcript_45289:54-890(-)
MGSGDLVNFNGGACPRRPAIQPGKDTCPEAKVVHRGGGGCKRHKSRFGVRIYPEYNGPASCDAATRAFWPRSIADGRLSVASELRYKESFCTHPPLRVPRRSNARTLRSRFSRKVVACTSLHTEGPHRASRVFTNGGSPCSAHAGPQFQASPYSLISGGAHLRVSKITGGSDWRQLGNAKVQIGRSDFAELKRHIPEPFWRPDRPPAKGWAVPGKVFLRLREALRRPNPGPIRMGPQIPAEPGTSPGRARAACMARFLDGFYRCKPVALSCKLRWEIC